MVTRIVLTGGPCAGKSSVLTLLQATLADQAVFVAEAATQLFETGTPLPTAEWGDAEWLTLQRRITARQLQLETEAMAKAEALKCAFTISDRAPFDNTAYPMGRAAVSEAFEGDMAVGLARYDLVIHLESLATARPAEYSQAGNTARYETLEQAHALELAAREAWSCHPKWVFLSGTLTIQQLTTRVLELITGEL